MGGHTLDQHHYVLRIPLWRQTLDQHQTGKGYLYGNTHWTTPHWVEDISMETQHTGPTLPWIKDISMETHTRITPHRVEDAFMEKTHIGTTPHWVEGTSTETHTGPTSH